MKGEWDRLRRKALAVHVVATGSSALRLGTGSRESLAGRFERLTLTHWTPAPAANLFGIDPGNAAELFVRMGCFPGAVPLRDDPGRWSAYIRDAIIEPALTRDILSRAEVRRPALLRQVFAVCAASPAQIVSLQKLQGRLQEAGALHTIAHYLQLLEDAFLVAPLKKYSTRPIRRRAAPPKLVTLNNALLSAGDPRGIPDPAREPDRFGAWVENACLAHAWNSGQRVAYWREEPYEVDAILEGDWGQWAVEVKHGTFEAADLRGLFEFTRRHPNFRPLVLTASRPDTWRVTRQGTGDRQIGDPQRALAARLGVVTQSWSDFLLAGPRSPDR